MKQKLFIHIGTPKTGSTYLQHFFLQNRNYLKRMGIYYPMEKNRSYFVPKINMHVSIIPSITKEKVLWLDPKYTYYSERPVIELISDIKNCGNSTNVISSEVFYDVFSKNNILSLKESFSQFEIFIIVYFRRQDQYILSLFQQGCKDGIYSQFNISKILNDMHGCCSYYAKIKKWGDVLGDDHIIVRPFEKEQFHESDLAKDFLNTLGVKSSKNLDYHVSRQNKSISLQKLLYLMALNKNLTSSLDNIDHSIKERDQEIRKRVINNTEILQDGDIKELLTIKRRKMILDVFESDNRKVAKYYMGKKDGKLFNNLP